MAVSVVAQVNQIGLILGVILLAVCVLLAIPYLFVRRMPATLDSVLGSLCVLAAVAGILLTLIGVVA